MYDYAGEWVYRVGLPAKSGVAGGILAVLPGQLAIGVFSPPLDECGNSVRGVAVCEALSDDLELHFLRAPRPSLSAVRARFSMRELASKRVRFDAEREVLAAHGDETAIYLLQGELSFAGMEAVIRRLVQDPPAVTRCVLDFSRVSEVDPPSARLLLELCASLAAHGRSIAFAGMARHPRLLRQLEEARVSDASHPLIVFDDLDAALEWCENAVLASHGVVAEERGELPLAKHELLRDLDREQLELLTSLMERRSYAAREVVVLEGDPADELFLLVHGALSVLSDRAEPGAVFGTRQGHSTLNQGRITSS